MCLVVKDLLCKEKEECVSNMHTQEVLETRCFWDWLVWTTSWHRRWLVITFWQVFLYPSRFVVWEIGDVWVLSDSEICSGTWTDRSRSLWSSIMISWHRTSKIRHTVSSATTTTLYSCRWCVWRWSIKEDGELSFPNLIVTCCTRLLSSYWQHNMQVVCVDNYRLSSPRWSWFFLQPYFLKKHHTGFWVRTGLTNPYSEILLYNMSSFTITTFVFFESTHCCNRRVSHDHNESPLTRVHSHVTDGVFIPLFSFLHLFINPCGCPPVSFSFSHTPHSVSSTKKKSSVWSSPFFIFLQINEVWS